MATGTCCACHRELRLTTRFFYRSSTSKSGFQSRCKDCDRKRSGTLGVSARPEQRQVKRERAYQRPRVKRDVCRTCYGLAHRRRRRGCPECGGQRRREPPMTLAQASTFTTDRTVFPEVAYG